MSYIIYIMSSRIIIYELSKYKGVYFNKTSNKWNVKSYNSDSLKKITSKLKDNKGYHIRINDTEKCILFGDIDHVNIDTDKQFFKKFINDFSNYLKIDKNDISYTISTKVGCLSYHWSYNKLYSDVKTMKKIIEDFLHLYPQYNINKYVDTSIYSNKWFRLPNQTNQDKPLMHYIKRGNMSDFLIHYIDDNATEYIPIFTKPKTKTKEILVDFENTKINNDIQTTSINCFQNTEIENQKLLNILDIDRVNDRTKWIKLGYLLFSIYEYDEGLSIFIKMSKLSLLYVDDTYIITTYETFKDKKYNINSLHYFAQQDNIIEYKKIIKHKFKKEVLLNEIIKIDRRYLLNINENLIIMMF